jgi:vancomycin resistance protein YoaR
MKKFQQHAPVNSFRIGVFFLLGVISGLVLLVGVARLAWHTKFYPGVKIANIEVSGLTREQAREKIKNATERYIMTLSFNGSKWTSSPDSSVFEIDKTINEAYRFGRRAMMTDYLGLLSRNINNYPLSIATGKTDRLEQLIQEIASSVELSPVDPKIELSAKKIVISNGVDGTVIDAELLDSQIRIKSSMLDSQSFEIPIKVVERALSNEEIMTLRSRAESLLGDSLSLTLDDQKIDLGEKELIAFLSTAGGTKLVDTASVVEYTNGLAQSLDKQPQDARFEFADGKVKEFAPGKDGIAVNVGPTVANIEMAIQKLIDEEGKTEAVNIAANRTAPKVTTEEVNRLGIKERIGRGESYYAHSIPNRIFNVALASDRINSALVPPGEEVSFNNMVGEVSSATGYRPAYIISGGRTILGDGGGLCQVSTTMFRAAMNAGLPILERWGHAYRVSYYELNSKPGVDATVIAPSKDFRFKNDTPGHILIQTINDPKALHLIIEIYGTSDGRVAEVSEPKVWGITPPLPTIYQDDPTLPAGTMKQVDWSASGAKASFDYKVTRNGEILQEKTFSTTYRAWASVFMKGTGI